MSPRTREKPATDEQLNEILNSVKAPLLKIAAEQHLSNAKVERWRWDEPVINLTWADQQLDRKIEVRVDGVAQHKDGRDFELVITVYARRDRMLPTATRHWQNEQINTMPVHYKAGLIDAKKLRGCLDVAYRTAARWNEADLALESDL